MNEDKIRQRRQRPLRETLLNWWPRVALGITALLLAASAIVEGQRARADDFQRLTHLTEVILTSDSAATKALK